MYVNVSPELGWIIGKIGSVYYSDIFCPSGWIILKSSICPSSWTNSRPFSFAKYRQQTRAIGPVRFSRVSPVRTLSSCSRRSENLKLVSGTSASFSTIEFSFKLLLIWVRWLVNDEIREGGDKEWPTCLPLYWPSVRPIFKSTRKIKLKMRT